MQERHLHEVVRLKRRPWRLRFMSVYRCARSIGYGRARAVFAAWRLAR